MNTTIKDYSKISPTAKLTAYWKSFSDIPYSKEISEMASAEIVAQQLYNNRLTSFSALAPSLFEARYKSINYALKKSEINNMMELASGLSPRGFEVVSNGGIYVGTDLQNMYLESSAIITHIANKSRFSMDNFYLQAANVLDKNDLRAAATHFKNEKFAICNEGLLPYLSEHEKIIMANNIKELLLENGGVWITTASDFELNLLKRSMASLLDEKVSKSIKSELIDLSDKTGTDISGNTFVDKNDAFSFYKALGFEIEEFPMYSGEYKLSTETFIPDDIKSSFINLLKSVGVFILTPKR